MEKSKHLYQSVVNKQSDEPISEKKMENGQEITITRVIKKVKPVKIAILKPDRKKYKEAEIFYAKRLSAYLKEGLLPHSLVSKRYLNDGGPLSEDEKKLVQTLRDSYVKLQEEYFGMKSPLTEDQTKRRAEIILELNEINKTLGDIQSNYSEIFSNTAEAKSKSDVIEWWILNLSLIEIDGKYQSLFGDGDFESKMKKLDELEEKDDEFTNEAIKKLSYFVSFWHTAGPEISEEDFKSAEENYNLNVSKYLIEESKEEPKNVEPEKELIKEPIKEPSKDSIEPKSEVKKDPQEII